MTTGATRAIALDGPSGSGKSTVARQVARALGWRYVDTGAGYRAVTLAALRAGVDLNDAAAVADVAGRARVEVTTDPDSSVTRLDGDDVSAEIRGPRVTAAVSVVSAVPAVRTRLVALQRALVAEGGAVVEGRDVGTVVLPDARLKVYLDASVHERARRRAGDRDAGVVLADAAPGGVLAPRDAPPGGHRADRGESPDAQDTRDDAALRSAVAVDLARRDALDAGRATSPLAAAHDAVLLDSSGMSADEVVRHVLDLARAAGLHAVDADA